MILYNQRRRIIRYIKFLWVLTKSSFFPAKKKSVYFDVSEVSINRYLYSFFKMFQLEGYSVYVPRNIELANVLSKNKGEFKYASCLVSEGVVKFGKPSGMEPFTFSKDQLCNDYFNFEIEGYRVPMSCYPWFYKRYARFKNYRVNELRKHSIFMSGNIDDQYYDQISKNKLFETIPSRLKTADYLRKTSFFYPLRTAEELDVFLNGNVDKKVIIIDSSKDFRIPLDNLAYTLNQFSFYLALPGIIIPQSHNLMEAMLCGCIPVIYRDYANLLDPPLEPFKNAIIFSSLKELEDLVEKVFQMKAMDIQRMRSNVEAYYQSYLTPSAVVKKVIQNHSAKIFIQAEHLSFKRE